jgi:hypothetical protein
MKDKAMSTVGGILLHHGKLVASWEKISYVVPSHGVIRRDSPYACVGVIVQANTKTRVPVGLE